MLRRPKFLSGLATLALLLPLLAACGGDATPTPRPVASATTAMAASTATTMMAAATNTTMMAAMTDTPMMAKPTDTAMMAMATPTAMMMATAMTGTMMTPMMPGMGTMTSTGTMTTAAAAPTEIAPNSTFTGSVGAFRWRQAEDAPNLDPALMQDSVSINFSQNLFDGLMEFDPATLSPKPSIAETYTVNADATVYTFKLRKDAKFTDGTPITAKDFVYSWNRLLANPAAPYSFVFDDIKGASEVVASAASTDTTKTKLTAAEGIKAVDDYTLQVTLKQASAYFIPQTALWSYWVVNQKVVGSNPLSSDWAQKAETMKGSGSGAYTVKEWVRNDHMVLEANDAYWNTPKASVKEIDILIIADGSTAQLRYENKQLDSSEIYVADYNRLKNDPIMSKELKEVPQASTMWLGFNALSGVFAQSGGEKALKLRQAVAQAMDREDLIDKALDGVGAPAYTLVPQGVPGFKDYQAYKLDIPAAKKALADAGYSDASSLKLTYYTRDREDQRKVGEVIQAQLKQNLGINVEVKAVPWSTFLIERQNHKYDFFYGRWGQDYPDPQDWLYALKYSTISQNNEGWANKQFDSMVDQANKLADPARVAERMKLYNDAEKLMLDDAAIVPLYQTSLDFLIKPGWSGWGYNSQFAYPFRFLTKQ